MAFLKLDSTNINQLKDFKESEFYCKCGKCNHNDQPYSFLLALLLQDVRTYFGKPLIITSARRCVAHNKKVGGVAKSKHTYYNGVLATVATDFYVKGVSYKQLVAYIKTIAGKYNVNYYYNVSGSVMHIDIKPPEYVEKYNLTRLLKAGCRGDDVKDLQAELQRRGYNIGKYGVDGIFGKSTSYTCKAVKQFQKDNKLFADGKVGKNTAHALGWLYKGK